MLMFKDYYLILKIGKDATPEEIEKAFENVVEKLSGKSKFLEFQDVYEAYSILSQPELRIMYDNELENYNKTDDFENYKIKNKSLENVIKSIPFHKEEMLPAENTDKTFGCIVQGCLIVIFIFVWFMSCVYSLSVKQKAKQRRLNSYSYIIPQNNKIICLQITTNY